MLENMFQDMEEFGQSNGVEMPSDPSEWQGKIIEQCFTTIPVLSNFKDASVEFNKADEEKGFAIGTIVIQGQDTKICVPFIIKNFVMSPLDVFIDNDGKMRPVTEERVKNALFNPSISTRLVDPTEYSMFSNAYPGSMGDMLPPSGGSHAGNKISLAEAIEPTITKEDREKLAAYLNAYPEIALEFAIKGKTAEIDRILTGTPQEVKKLASSIDATWYDIFQVNKNDNYNVTVKMASSRYNDPFIKDMDIPTAIKLAEELAQQGNPGMQQAMEQPGAVVAPDQGAPMQDPSNYIDIDTCMQMTPVDAPGMYKVMSVMGDKLVGYCFSTVLDFNLQPMPVKMFAGLGQLALQEEIIGELVDSSAKPNATPIAQGGTYVFAFFGDQKGQALALAPVQIMSVTALEQQIVYIAADMFNQVPMALIPMRGLETVMPATPEMLGELAMLCGQAQAAYFIPGDIKGIAVNGQVQLIQHPQEAMQIMQMGGPQAYMAMQQQQAAQQQQMEQQQMQGAPNAQGQAQQPQQSPPQQGQQAPQQPQTQKQASFTPISGVTGRPSGSGILSPKIGWTNINGQTGLPENFADETVADAENVKVSHKCGRLVYDKIAGDFWLDSPYAVKEASEKMSADDAMFALLAAGASINDVNEIVKIARYKDECPVYDLNPPTSLHNEMALYKEACAHNKDIADELRGYVTDNFIKVASMVSSDEDADSVLSLNFINSENMQMFKEKLPQLSEAESSLANLLMAVRLGEKRIPEKLVKECMDNMSQIIDALKGI